jgi:hypothetical protein
MDIKEIYEKMDIQKKILAQKKLKVWNGRGLLTKIDSKVYSSIYVCAKTKKQAIELCQKVGFRHVNYNEMQTYWAACWGNSMCHVEPEIGLWAETDNNVINRLA